MPRVLLLLRIFNTVVTGLIFAVVTFLSLAFYLGNQETHRLLEEHLVKNLFLRFGAFALFGLAVSILPVVINLLVVWLTPLPIVYAYRLALKAALSSVAGALLGTALFFNL
jgi:hypothetical protein